jgi:hypothetical protein|tara:strand:+ start:44 stop:199 length:156 start_codon:yes stop_codon:yes gene_type:complete
MIEELTKTQEEANNLLAELLKTVKFSNKVLLMVNGVNILTVIMLMIFIIKN